MKIDGSNREAEISPSPGKFYWIKIKTQSTFEYSSIVKSFEKQQKRLIQRRKI